ncbi:DUF2857 domain-containing protein [Enterobacter cloacae complex sp. 2021EL-01169]|uniref:DUF2857 domain-containing protein n=1 Tax=Enterobacter cloacae complex sp. 2021EL-01169 TaxID=2887193 RepID=UPI001D15C29D|nr:DUF2857 domain-containing protein [Enterobacter cloacae complex sp. 2021EL-01169]MCC3239063.1 DUF2857 domain-containing protein [Enterobacter cloacae complex sp. 2021EL-01169]
MIPSLNHAVLTEALYALKEGDFRHCKTLGFTFDEMNSLNQLTLDQLFIISRASDQFISVTIHHDAFQQILALSRQEIQRQQQMNRAIRLGASITLLSQYFGLTSNEICFRRRLLGIVVPMGRPPVPDEETDAEIWRRWQKHRVENLLSFEALEVMMQITEALSALVGSLSLNVVWSRISLCEKEISARRRSTHAG